ncbi:MAG: Grx4 family monothiol glutaredoxin [Gammaproteobacteria bacterium]
MSINERIEEQLNQFPVLLYMKGTPDFPQCGFSAEVVGALKALKTRFAYVNILEDPELRQGLKDYSEWPTFPQLYVKGELIGGSDIATEMFESGELQTLIEGIEPEE